MAYHAKEMNEWAIRKIETEAPEDVDLLIGSPQWNVPEDGDEISFNYFLPNSDRGFELAMDFIVEGVGYDFWAMPWERLEHLATLKEGITISLLDGVVLWARNDEAVKRFTGLQDLARARLQDTAYCYQTALLNLDEALNLYKVLVFDDNLSHARKGLSRIASLLSDALGTLNGIYFKRGPENQDQVLDTLKHVPEGFTDTYRQIPFARDVEDCRKLAHTLIAKFRGLMVEMKPRTDSPALSDNYSDLASWYEEGAYWFRRLYTYTRNGDAAKTLQWGCSLQAELDYVANKYGLKPMDILDLYDPEDLMVLNRRGHEVQKYLHQVILDHGVKIREFDSIEDFLNSGL